MEVRITETLMSKPAVIVILILVMILTLFLMNVATNNGIVRFFVCGLASWMPFNFAPGLINACGAIPV